MADTTRQFNLIQDNNKKIDSKLLKDYKDTPDNAKTAISECKLLLQANLKTVSYLIRQWKLILYHQ